MIKFALLQRFIAIFLFLQIGTNNVFAEELVKLPKLFTHYYHHAREHRDTGDFLTFLHRHYSEHHKNDEHEKKHPGEDKDCALPFKHCGNCCLGIHSTPAGVTSSYLTANCNLFQSETAGFISVNEHPVGQNPGSIWQPPKLVRK